MRDCECVHLDYIHFKAHCAHVICFDGKALHLARVDVLVLGNGGDGDDGVVIIVVDAILPFSTTPSSPHFARGTFCEYVNSDIVLHAKLYIWCACAG